MSSSLWNLPPPLPSLLWSDIFDKSDPGEFLYSGPDALPIKALRCATGRTLVVKLLPPGGGSSCLHAASALYSMRHRNIATAEGIATRSLPSTASFRVLGELTTTEVALVEESRGTPLLDWLSAVFHRLPGIPSSVESAAMEVQRRLECVRQLASALAYAHSLGISHGDVRPSNVLVDGEGQVRLARFSLAPYIKISKEVPFEMMLLAARNRRAQLLYKDPVDVGVVGERAVGDVYSFGITAWQIMSGKEPFENESVHEEGDLRSRIGGGLRPDLDLLPHVDLSVGGGGRAAPAGVGAFYLAA